MRYLNSRNFLRKEPLLMIPIYIRSWLNGRLVGIDQFGSKYYEERCFFLKRGERFGQPRFKRRWVIYKKNVEASLIPPEWHGWLHRTVDEIPEQRQEFTLDYKWQKPYQPNATGTPQAHAPKGSLLKNDAQDLDYEAWTPGVN